MDLISNETFTQWMELIRLIIERDIPAASDTVEVEERPDLPCWKIKKWAMNIVYRCFERYGSPNSVHKMYKSFATFFIRSFSRLYNTHYLVPIPSLLLPYPYAYPIVVVSRNWSAWLV